MWRAHALGYLIVSQHFLTVLSARELGGSSTLGTTSVSAADLPATTTSVSPTIPNYRGKKLRQDLKKALVKASKCPIPRTQSADEVCDWFACKYKQHKGNLEELKVKMEEDFVRQTPLAAWFTKRRNEKTAEDYLLSSRKTRTMYFRSFYYAVLQFDGGCDPEQEAIDDLLDWTKIVFPQRYECIEEVVGKHLETHATCAEGFTHAFKLDMFKKCKNKKFYAEERLVNVGKTIPGVHPGEVAADVVIPDQPVSSGTAKEYQVAKTTTPAWQRGVLGTAGMISGIAAPPLGLGMGVVAYEAIFGLDMLKAVLVGTGITIDVIAGVALTAITTSFALLGLGILGASIALLVCKYKPAKKREGVRLSQQKHDR